jgi:hypothetical protein
VLRGKDHRLDIDPHHALPCRQRFGDDTAAARDADVVVEEVEVFDRGFDHDLALRGLGDVGAKRYRPSACVSDHRDGSLGEGRFMIDDQHFDARKREQNRSGATIADAVPRRPASGDDRHLSGEARVVTHRRCHRLHPSRSSPAQGANFRRQIGRASLVVGPVSP